MTSAAHEHEHNSQGVNGAARAARKRSLRAALFVTAAFFLVEVVGGLLSGSLALLADAAHMFTDVAALILAYAAMELADRGPTKRYTFGLYRAEILAAFVNAQLLLVIAGYVFYEAYSRFHQPPEIEIGIMMGVAAAGLVANLVSLRFLHGHHHDSLNAKAAYLEVLTDTLGSVAVIAAAVMMMPTGWYWLDPLVSVGIGLFIVPRTFSILRQSAHILLEGTPRHVDLTALRADILEIDGVEELHDLHFWTLTSGVDCLSVHIRISPHAQQVTVRGAVQQFLSETAGIDHATIQVEDTEEEACAVAAEHR